MGLFDFLKPKPKRIPAAQDDGPEPDYVFAHYALRQIALSDPLTFLAISASPKATEFMDSVLQDVAKQCGRKTSFDSASIKIHPMRVKEFPCAVVELGEPKEMAEAFMVALVVPVDLTAEPRPDIDSVEGRYFTLEKGFSLSDNEPRTVLAEWSDGGAHSNFGDGPEPTVEAFVTAIREHV